MSGAKYNPGSSVERAAEGSAGEIGQKRTLTARRRGPSQTALSGVRSTKQEQELSHQSQWLELVAVLFDSCKGLPTLDEILGITGWRPVRVPDGYHPTGNGDPLRPGMTVFVPPPNLDTDHLVNSDMDSIDTELASQENPRGHTDFGGATED